MPLRQSSTEISKQVEVNRPTETARRKRPGLSTPTECWGRQIRSNSPHSLSRPSLHPRKTSWLSQYGGFTFVLTAAASMIGAVIGGWYTAAVLASIALAECIAMTALIRTDANHQRGFSDSESKFYASCVGSIGSSQRIESTDVARETLDE